MLQKGSFQDDSASHEGQKNVRLGSVDEEFHSEVREMVVESVKSSSTRAVSILGKEKNNYWFCWWLVIVTVQLFVALYQSEQLLRNYFQYPSYLVQEEKLNNTLYYPSLTLCPQNFINWETIKETNHSLLHVVEDFIRKNQKENAILIKLRLQDLILNKLNSMNASERNQVLLQKDDWLKLCIGNDGLLCEEQPPDFIITTYSPYYGNCVTINSGLTSILKGGLDHSGLFIVTEIKQEMEFPYMIRDSGLFIVLHGPGTAPVPLWNKKIEVDPGEFVDIAVQADEIHRLQAPYASNCTTGDQDISMILQDSSPYRSEGIQYTYSREECMATCYNGYINEHFHCQYSFFATTNKTEKRKLPICEDEDMTIEILDELEASCSKECPKLCSELVYEWTPLILGIPKRPGMSRDLIQLMASENQSNLEDFIGLSVMFETNTYTVYHETEKYKIGDIIGAIGGVLSLWLGFTLISVWEILRLLLSVFALLGKKTVQCFRFYRNQGMVITSQKPRK